MKKVTRFFRKYYLFSAAVITVVIALVLHTAQYVGATHVLLAVIAILEVLPLLWGMLKDLRDGTYGIDILAAAAIISAVLFHEYWAAMVIVIMLTGGEVLEDYAEQRAQSELSSLLSKAPKYAHVIKGKQITEVAISAVHVGDKLIVKPGEVVPVDGQIVEGSAQFDEANLTGESIPQSKQSGDQVLAGSVSVDGAVTIKTIRPAAESQYEQIIALVRAAGNSQTPFVRLADRYSIPFTAISFTIAIVAWITSGQSIRFLEVLVVATPCPLILAAPIAVISGMSRAARYGIIIKSGGALERLAEAQTFAFDKTGTLTAGNLVVQEVVAFNRQKQNDVLLYAATLEQSSNHVLA